LQVKGAELVEAESADTRELVEELGERFSATLFDMAPSVEFVEGLGFAVVENSTDAEKPVFLVGVNEMADHVRYGEGAFSLIAAGPELGEIAQECIESGWGALEERYGVRELMGHRQRMLTDCGSMQRKSGTEVPLPGLSRSA